MELKSIRVNWLISHVETQKSKNNNNNYSNKGFAASAPTNIASPTARANQRIQSSISILLRKALQNSTYSKLPVSWKKPYIRKLAIILHKKPRRYFAIFQYCATTEFIVFCLKVLVISDVLNVCLDYMERIPSFNQNKYGTVDRAYRHSQTQLLNPMYQ